MVVYAGARLHPAYLPRRRAPARARARRRSSRLGLTLAGIVTGFLLALFYLTQTIHVAATNYDVNHLLAERERLVRQLQSLEGDIARWGAEPAVVEGAQRLGLSRLGGTVRAPSR